MKHAVVAEGREGARVVAEYGRSFAGAVVAARARAGARVLAEPMGAWLEWWPLADLVRAHVAVAGGSTGGALVGVVLVHSGGDANPRRALAKPSPR